MYCSICGGTEFSCKKVLWKKLIDEWQISPTEVAYIDRQQGESCDQCGANIRSIALANAIRAFIGTQTILSEAIKSKLVQDLFVLEINEAGTLSPLLKKFRHYTFGAYPKVDMHALPYNDSHFDLLIHSDTLEHVNNPIHALRECYRVLRVGGALCFTVPLIVGRLSRNREGLPKSYHGNPERLSDDYSVKTEFGADAWTYILEAGFTEVSIHTAEYPSGIAFLATRSA